MSAAIEQFRTAEEFERLPDQGMRYQIVRGVVMKMMPPGGEQGGLPLTLGTHFQLWVERGAGGYADVESGCVFVRKPDTVREPNVYYVRADRMLSSGTPRNF